jgi:hypothetical protein
MSKLLRYLRIAFSAGCGALCLLLIALWAWSYTIRDVIYWPEKSIAMEINSLSGHVVLMVQSLQQAGGEFPPFRTEHSAIAGHRTLLFNHDVLGFLLRRQADLTRIDIPFWFLLLTSVAITSAPWLREKWRFSVRTLLIATTVVAAVLGFAVYTARGQF